MHMKKVHVSTCTCTGLTYMYMYVDCVYKVTVGFILL